MVVLNEMSRYHLAQSALRYIPRLRLQGSNLLELLERKLHEHQVYIRQHFEDQLEITNWVWTSDFSEWVAAPSLAVGQPRAALFTDS